MESLYDGASWQVKGPGSERARVAFARLAGEAVTYSIQDKKTPIASTNIDQHAGIANINASSHME